MTVSIFTGALARLGHRRSLADRADAARASWHRALDRDPSCTPALANLSRVAADAFSDMGCGESDRAFGDEPTRRPGNEREVRR